MIEPDESDSISTVVLRSVDAMKMEVMRWKCLSIFHGKLCELREIEYNN